MTSFNDDFSDFPNTTPAEADNFNPSERNLPLLEIQDNDELKIII